jgi:ABC-type glycerol-3-phosphate transport system permease component
VAAWCVRSVGGYTMLEGAAHGTWTGADPSAVVFLGLAALLALGTVSVAINSGLLPTGLLVAAPVFGAAVTRYGTETSARFGPEVVSLPEAVGMAGLVAVGVTVPVTVAAFLLGYAVRRLVRVFGGAGPTSRPEEV